MEAPGLRVLSLDGGGVHVQLQIALLARIFDAYPHLFDTIDVFAGTSAGALLALALAVRGVDTSKAIFNEGNIAGMFERSYIAYAIPSDGVLYSKYENTTLAAFLRAQFGETRIADVEKKIFVPTFQLNATAGPQLPPEQPGRAKWAPRYFTNFDAPPTDLTDDDENPRLTDLALRTTAAPTYFPVHQGYCDGGVVANNPSGALLIRLRRLGYDLSHVSVLSLGAGDKPTTVPAQDAQWGAYNWLPYVVSMLVSCNVFTGDETAEALLGERYCRFDPALDKDVALDDTEALAYLREVAEAVDLTPVFEWIERYWPAPASRADPPSPHIAYI